MGRKFERPNLENLTKELSDDIFSCTVDFCPRYLACINLSPLCKECSPSSFLLLRFSLCPNHSYTSSLFGCVWCLVVDLWFFECGSLIVHFDFDFVWSSVPNKTIQKKKTRERNYLSQSISGIEGNKEQASKAIDVGERNAHSRHSSVSSSHEFSFFLFLKYSILVLGLV